MQLCYQTYQTKTVLKACKNFEETPDDARLKTFVTDSYFSLSKEFEDGDARLRDPKNSSNNKFRMYKAKKSLEDIIKHPHDIHSRGCFKFVRWSDDLMSAPFAKYINLLVLPLLLDLPFLSSN